VTPGPAPDQRASLTIRVDRDVCMGSGMCCVYAPNTFDIDDEAKSFVKDPQGDDEAHIRSAVEACPTRALSLADLTDDTGA
jgi:ferredoxin